MRFSVVIPSFERRRLVVRAVQALTRQDFVGPFEVIVVVDGSTDGSAEALRELSTPFPLRVISQENQGSAAARSTGGFAAQGEILLFMDDDMEADSGMLSAHDDSHRAGASIVIGHIPLHPTSPRGLLSTWVDSWVERRKARLEAAGAEPRVTDLVGGQISVARAAFAEVGGFDARLTRHGAFGNEDIEFGHRLLERGYRAVFNPAAISYQEYTVTPRTFLRQWRQAGAAGVHFARKHPAASDVVLRTSVNRRRYRWVASVPWLAAPLRRIALALLERGREDPVTERIFFLAQAVEFCRGLRDAGGVPRAHPLRVLAFHAVEPREATGRLAPYEITPASFRRLVENLSSWGYHFVSPAEVLAFLRGAAGLPRRPVLLTFDDCYVSVVEHALPVMQELDVPGLAFAPSAFLGSVNGWDAVPAEARLPILDAAGLRRLSRSGMAIGAHSRTHPVLSKLTPAELTEEVAGSREELRALGLGDVVFFAYPYGESNDEVQRAVQAAGCAAAFTVEPGVIRRGDNPYALPRIEILRGDDGWRLRRKVAWGGALRDQKHGRAAAIPTLWRRWARPALDDAGARLVGALRSRASSVLPRSASLGGAGGSR